MMMSLFSIGTSSCKKSSGSTPPDPQDTAVIVNPQIDPALAATIGFFNDDWQPVNFTIPSYTDTTVPASAPYIVNIDRSNVLTKIPRSMFGNNGNIWMTQMMTEPVLLDHITKLHPHIIRFPGGSLSNKFFWNALPNQPPSDAPAQLLNASGTPVPAGYWFGKNNESWTLSVDNYYNMLAATGNQGMITINYGYARYGTGPDPVAAAAKLAADWVRYDNGRTKYWEIGNETFGDWEAGYRINTSANQDGQPEYQSGQLYGQHFKVFADSMRKAAIEIGKTIYIGAVTVEAESPAWATQTHRNWNTGMLAAADNSPDYYVIHSYYTPYNANSNATEILSSASAETGKMINFVKQAIQTAGKQVKPVAMNEWNIFAVNSRQMVSHVNGLHADILLGEALTNNYGMTARWDLANGWENGNDHGMFNIGDEPNGVPKWEPRPAFFHMYFFRKFLGDRLVKSSISNAAELKTYASSFTSGETGVTLINTSTTDRTVEIKVQNFRKGARYYWYTLTGGTDNGEFSGKVYVNGKTSLHASGGPANYHSLKAYSASTANGIFVTVPRRSAIFMVIDNQ